MKLRTSNMQQPMSLNDINKSSENLFSPAIMKDAPKLKPTLQVQETEEDIQEFSEEEENINGSGSPAALLHKKHQYVMLANSSKLARKPYYKQLQKNKFEREFSLIMDQT